MYFISTDRESRQGPFKLEVINEKLVAGQITSDTWVWSKGMTTWQRIRDIDAFRDALESVPPPFEAEESETPPSFSAFEPMEKAQPKAPKQPTWIDNELKALNKPLSERTKKKLPILLITLILAFPDYSKEFAEVALRASNLPSEIAIYDLLGGYAGVVAFVVGYYYALPYAPAYFFCKTEETRHRVHWILAIFWCLLNLLAFSNEAYVM